jgi:hypothetical protein
MLKASCDTTTQLKATPCPECRYKLDAATAAFSHAKPGPGDVTVCINCAALLEFTDELGLKACNTHALPLDALEQLAEVQAAVRKMHRERESSAK